MYLHHYGLRDRPFKLAHDPAYYYPAAHQVPINELCYVIEERQGLATLIGEPGTGKTTILKRLLQILGPQQKGVFLSDASPGRKSLLSKLHAALEIPSSNLAFGEESLKTFLINGPHITLVLLVDEAQNLTRKQLQEIQQLTNLEHEKRKLIDIIMAGQPSLVESLATPELAALQQRVAVRTQLEPLDIVHTQAYIKHHLRTAGSPDTDIFSSQAIQAIQQHSFGIPRLINIICDRSLIVGFAKDVWKIGEEEVQEAISELRIVQDVAEPPPHEKSESTMGGEPLTTLGSRISSLEEKMDTLVQMLARGGVVNPEFADPSRMRRWVESLKHGKRMFHDKGENVAEIKSTDRGPQVKEFPHGRTVSGGTRD